MNITLIIVLVINILQLVFELVLKYVTEIIIDNRFVFTALFSNIFGLTTGSYFVPIILWLILFGPIFTLVPILIYNQYSEDSEDSGAINDGPYLITSIVQTVLLCGTIYIVDFFEIDSNLVANLSSIGLLLINVINIVFLSIDIYKSKNTETEQIETEQIEISFKVKNILETNGKYTLKGTLFFNVSKNKIFIPYYLNDNLQNSDYTMSFVENEGYYNNGPQQFFPMLYFENDKLIYYPTTIYKVEIEITDDNWSFNKNTKKLVNI